MRQLLVRKNALRQTKKYNARRTAALPVCHHPLPRLSSRAQPGWRSEGSAFRPPCKQAEVVITSEARDLLFSPRSRECGSYLGVFFPTMFRSTTCPLGLFTSSTLPSSLAGNSFPGLQPRNTAGHPLAWQEYTVFPRRMEIL